MKRSFVEAVLTVTMIIMMSTAGHAGFAVPHNLQCDNCHGKFAGAADLMPNNACLTCHSALGEASRKPVGSDAMSNYFQSALETQPATGSRSTHTWAAYSAPGHPYNPKAMVHEPTNPALNSGYGEKVLTGKSTCFRCHNSKLDYGLNQTVGVDKPLLRATNVNDALCRDCHRDRDRGADAISHGTHPINNGIYSSVYKKKPTAFRKVPISANSNNPTANPGNYLSSTGKILCSTCHAPHYADSSSATFGNRSTANGFAQDDNAKGLKGMLQDSKGQLLRTDPLGATAAAINICSSCHLETANLNHNGKSQNIQCNHCHGAHVDYTGDGSNANLALVRRDFSYMSTAKLKLGANVKAIFNTSTSNFKRSDGKGICQVCHALPSSIEAHNLATTKKKDCLTCHRHENGFSAENCTSCHGQPPTSSYVGGPNGKASQNYTLDESFTPHATHASAGYYNYACKNCHYDGVKAGSHNTGSSFTDVFIDTTGSIGDQPGLTKNVLTDYKFNKTCESVYCHSNGNPRGGPYVTVATPSWANGKNKIVGQATECNTCHGVGVNLTTNVHQAHVTTSNIKCIVCHVATVTAAGAISSRANHANGTKDVVFVTRPDNFLSVFDASYDPQTATCTNSCHTNGFGVSPATPAKWNDAATGACGTCHAAAPVSNNHGFHFYSSTGSLLGTLPAVCSNCHVGTSGDITHANGIIDLKLSCSPCHPGTSPLWTAKSVTCESCHAGAQPSKVRNSFGSYTASLKSLNATAGHGQYTLLVQACTTCHNATAPHIGAGPTQKRLLIAGNDLCASCHTLASGKGLPEARIDLPVHGGSVNKFSHYSSASDLVRIAAVRADACAGCHDTHGTTNKLSVRTTINGLSVVYTGSTPNFIETTPDGNGLYHGLCQVCHTKTKYFNRDNTPPSSHATAGCLTCHKHKDVDGHFAFFPSNGGCGDCHGYPPARITAGLNVLGNYTNAMFQKYSGGGGAHTVAGHIPKTVRQSDGFINCTNCHYNTNHNQGGTVQRANVNVIVDPKFKFNNTTSITYNASNCSNVSCHFKPTPNWTNGL